MLASEEFEYRNPQRLSLDVEQRRFDRAERRAKHRPRPPVGIAMQCSHKVLDCEWVFAEHEALRFFERGDDRLGPPLERGLPDPVDPGVGKS